MAATRSRPSTPLLFLLFARYISAYHATPISPDIAWESCSNSSFSFTWQVQNFTISSTSNTTFAANTTDAATYTVSFFLSNNALPYDSVCAAEVNSPDGDSGWLICAPPAAHLGNILKQGEGDGQDANNQKTGDKLYSGPRLKHNYNGTVSRYDGEEGEGDYEVVPGIGQLKPHPLAVSRDQSPTKRRKRAEKSEPSADNTYPPRLVEALSTSSFLFNRSSGLLNVTQNWVCNSEDEGGFTVNFNASGGVNVSDYDFDCVTDPDSNIIGAHKLGQVRLDIHGDGAGATVAKRHASDTGVIDCSAAENFTVTPYAMRAWTEDEV